MLRFVDIASSTSLASTSKSPIKFGEYFTPLIVKTAKSNYITRKDHQCERQTSYTLPFLCLTGRCGDCEWTVLPTDHHSPRDSHSRHSASSDSCWRARLEDKVCRFSLTVISLGGLVRASSRSQHTKNPNQKTTHPTTNDL